MDKHQRDIITFCEQQLISMVEPICTEDDPDAIAQCCLIGAQFEAQNGRTNNVIALLEIRDMAAQLSRQRLGAEYGKLYAMG